MSSKRYTEEFNVEAVKQVTERGYPAAITVRGTWDVTLLQKSYASNCV